MRLTFVALAALALTGCKAREIGVDFADRQSARVDPTWVSAAKSCWPALAHGGYSDGSLEHQLADPLHFRAAFTAYAALSDAALISIVSRPVDEAPGPDNGLLAHASTPLLTRDQAASGAAPTSSPSSGLPSTDALCAIHPGTPVGFR